jgi:hypothetical protein
MLRHAVLPRPEGNVGALMRHLLLDAALMLLRRSSSVRYLLLMLRLLRVYARI